MRHLATLALLALAVTALPAVASAGPAPVVQAPTFPPNTIGRPRPVTPHGAVRNVILALDSDTIQAGIGGDTAPRLVVPAVAGAPRGSGTAVAFGNDALARRAQLSLVYPIQKQVITNFAVFGQLVRYVLGKLGVAPANARILVSEPLFTSKAVRMRLTTTIFNGVGAQAFYVAQEPVLALYASGRTTGVVLEGDRDITRVAPIYEGYALPHAALRLDIGEADILKRWSALEAPRGVPANDETDQRRLDQTFGYIALNPRKEQHAASPFRLSSGRTITVGTERFMAPEAYFEPQLISLEQEGIHKLVYEFIMKCDVDIRKDLYNNIVIAGRLGHYRGLGARLQAGVKALAPTAMTTKVVQPADATNSVFIGESILASLSTFDAMYITRAEYQQQGPAVVLHKCT